MAGEYPSSFFFKDTATTEIYTVPYTTLFRSPRGQTKAPDAAEPSFGPSRRLDYELELGFYVAQGNALGEPLSMDAAEERLFGVSLLNDWSARDLQAWEYQPLGPFLSKSFASTVSPWIVTAEAQIGSASGRARV